MFILDSETIKFQSLVSQGQTNCDVKDLRSRSLIFILFYLKNFKAATGD